MYEGEKHFDPPGTPKYTARSTTRHRNGSGVRRLVFFMLASVWGFIAGVTGVLVALAATGHTVDARPIIVAGLIPAVILSLAGGWVVAAAYRESKQRAR